MPDIRSFFKKPDDNVAVGVTATKEKRTMEAASCGEPPPKKKKVTFDPAADVRPKSKPGPKPKDTPVLKLLAVKKEGECAGFCAKPEYQHHSKLVIATHKNYRLRTDDTTTKTIKQRGDIDAEIGEHETELGCDEILALVEAALGIAEAIVEGKGRKLVVVAYRKKGAHGAYLLGKLAWKFAAQMNATLGEASKVGEPGNWCYSELWKIVKTIKDPKTLTERMEQCYSDTH